jgi:endo-1,4-beta-xylanase
MLCKRMLTRRNAISLGLGTLAGIGITSIGRTKLFSRKTKVLSESSQDFVTSAKASLKERAAAKGLIFGAASRYENLVSDRKLADRFVKDCALLVPEWELKWSAGSSLLRPTPDGFDFTKGDWLVKFAQNHNLLVQGHTLVWHLSLPHWFADTITSHNAKHFLSQHIQKVVQHYRGQMHSWCVVNEAIAYDPRKGRSDGLQESPWLKFLGPQYIDFAFREAASADPEALLFYNDYGMDYDNSLDEAKRTAVLKLLERLKASGTPVHALGIQAHLRGEATDFNPRTFRDFLKNVADLDLKIMITELDVNDQHLSADNNVRDYTVAKVYEDYLSVALDEPATIAVITWGLSDRYTQGYFILKRRLSKLKPCPALR